MGNDQGFESSRTLFSRLFSMLKRGFHWMYLQKRADLKTRKIRWCSRIG